MTRKPNPLWLLPLLASSVAAQLMDTASSSNSPVGAISIFDLIKDSQERSLFKELTEMNDPRQARQQAADFVERYPRSVVLRETYEVAARASAALEADGDALEWGRRALRLLPENPVLLAMIAEVAARDGQHQFAEKSARQALRYLEGALPPAEIQPADWPQVRNSLRNQANFALGLSASEEGRYADAERWLLDALRTRPDDYAALYALGLARLKTNDSDADAAASCFAAVVNAREPSGDAALRDAALRLLRTVYAAKMRSQSFKEFAASQRFTMPAVPAQPASPPGTYAGSASCRPCHEPEFRNWKSTGMANMFRPYSERDVIGRFSGEEIMGGSIRTDAENGQRFIELRNATSGKWTRYRVDALIGSKWQQAYASLLPDGGLVVLPVQYSRLEGGWVNYWKSVDGSSARSDIAHFKGVPEGSLYQRDCAPCHTSQLTYAAGAPPSTARIREGGIDCEMCHGPSQAHVDAMRASPQEGPRVASAVARNTDGLPVDFSKISAEESVAICGQCHMQSRAHDPEASGAVNYSTATPFYRAHASRLLVNYKSKVFYADGRFRATTFVGEAFERSRCFLEGGATCVSCHNPHPGDAASNPKSLKFAADSDEMCLQCHQALRDRPERHTRHERASEASRCVSCHMPRNMDAVLFLARSHQIDEIPDAEMTARFGESDSPNASLGCHRDKDVRWLTGSMVAWRGR